MSGGNQREAAYWNDFYAQMGFNECSSFARYVAESKFSRSAVLDIGCGDGRDSRFFAQHGKRVIGLDQSKVAIDLNQQRAVADKQDNLEFMCASVDSQEALHLAAKKLRGSDGVLFYCRFVLHALEEPTQQSLIQSLSELMQSEDVFAAEFRTAKDEHKNHVHGNHYRRYQAGTAVADQLAATGKLKVAVYQEGNGFSPYKDEDPELCRILAVRV